MINKKITKTILRICHKYKVDNDGYDLDVIDLTKTMDKYYNQYILTFLPESYRNNSTRKKIFYFVFKDVYKNYVNDLYSIKNILAFLPFIKNVFAKVNPDVVHIHGTLTLQFLVASIYARLKGKKVIVTYHMGKINKANNSFFIKFLKAICHNTFPLIAINVIAPSNYSRSSFLYNKKVKVEYAVKKPVKSNKTFQKIIKENSLLKTSKTKRLQIIYPARYAIQKNHIILLKAFKKILKTRKDITLILCGNTNSNNFTRVKDFILRNNLENHIILLHELGHKECIKLISGSNFLVFPALNEGLGRVCLEAMYFGVPVLASDDSGAKELITQGKNGLLFNAKKKREIFKCILKAFDTEFKASATNEFSKYISFIRGLYK